MYCNCRAIIEREGEQSRETPIQARNKPYEGGRSLELPGGRLEEFESLAAVVTGVSTVSALINPDGSLVALDTDLNGSRRMLVSDVSLGSGPTLYTALGDIPGWIALAGFVFFMFFQSMIERRARKAAASTMGA